MTGWRGVLAGWLAAACGVLAAAAGGRPNVVVLLADDLGWKDLGCTGSPWHRTPNLDRLRGEGMWFTEAHAAAPICSASRAALLTGLTAARLHYEFVPKWAPGRQPGRHPLQAPDYPTELPAGTATLGSLLGAAGYTTAFAGKWHLNRHHGHYLGWSPTHGPHAFGFAHCIDDLGGHPYSYPQGGSPPPDLDGEALPPDRLTDRALEFLARPHDRPFLLWMAYYYVHDPYHSRSRGRVDRGRRALPQGAGAQRAHYAAMVETLDHEAGRLLDALERSGRAADTLVVFTSDNGGQPLVSSNAPLRGCKWTLYQGGLRVPLVVRWPGRVAAGSRCAAPVCGTDLLPTLLEAAGREPPAGLDGRSLLPLLDGRDDGSWRDRPLAWHFPFYQPETGYGRARPSIGVDDFAVPQVSPHAALRRGDHKLVHWFETGAAELYDLAADPAESRNLAPERPDLAGALDRQLLDTLAAQHARMPVKSPPPEP